jgi:hypothetical protein
MENMSLPTTQPEKIGWQGHRKLLIIRRKTTENRNPIGSWKNSYAIKRNQVSHEPDPLQDLDNRHILTVAGELHERPNTHMNYTLQAVVDSR